MYVIASIAAVYGGLSAIAALVQGKNGDTCAMMIIGGCMMIAAAGLCVYYYSFDWIISLTGSLLISIAALINGKRGEFHAKHHVIRAVVEAILIIGFIVF